MLAKLQRYFVHQPCKESSYFKLFGPVYTQSYHGSPRASQLYTFMCRGVYFWGPGLSPFCPLFWLGVGREFWDKVLG